MVTHRQREKTGLNDRAVQTKPQVWLTTASVIGNSIYIGDVVVGPVAIL